MCLSPVKKYYRKKYSVANLSIPLSNAQKKNNNFAKYRGNIFGVTILEVAIFYESLVTKEITYLCII